MKRSSKLTNGVEQSDKQLQQDKTTRDEKTHEQYSYKTNLTVWLEAWRLQKVNESETHSRNGCFKKISRKGSSIK